jgi:acetyl esterase/lipase
MRCNSAALPPSGTRQRLTALALRATVRIALKPVLSPRVPVPWQRWWLRRLTQRPGPRRVEVHDRLQGGAKGEWLRSRRADPNSGQDSGQDSGQGATMLYLHGGGYCIGSPATHRAVTARLARSTGLPVFAADYRLAPEHPFPAALDDAVAAYRSLSDMGPVIVAGDSAGGGLALATALAVRQSPLPAPVALILFAPWVDLMTSSLSEKAEKSEAVLSRAWLAACARHYLAGGDPTAPLASPIHGDLRGLPPVLIQVAADELLVDNAVRLRDALLRAGVAVRCEVIPALWHGFHLHAGMLRSADAAIDRAARFIADTMAPLVRDPAR